MEKEYFLFEIHPKTNEKDFNETYKLGQFLFF